MSKKQVTKKEMTPHLKTDCDGAGLVIYTHTCEKPLVNTPRSEGVSRAPNTTATFRVMNIDACEPSELQEKTSFSTTPALIPRQSLLDSVNNALIKVYPVVSNFTADP